MVWNCTENDPDICAQRHFDLIQANKRVEKLEGAIRSYLAEVDAFDREIGSWDIVFRKLIPEDK